MNRYVVPKGDAPEADSQRCSTPAPLGQGFGAALACLVLLIWCNATSLAQAVNQPTSSAAPVSVHSTHLLGFEGAKSNAKGTLSIRGDELQFQKNRKPAVQVKIASVLGVFVGGQSHQVGGLPMTLGKAATPFGGGRVVSLFAHKKYDILSLEYVDANGAAHGAVFQLDKGQADVVRTALILKGVPASNSEDQPKQKTTAEVSNESK